MPKKDNNSEQINEQTDDKYAHRIPKAIGSTFAFAPVAQADPLQKQKSRFFAPDFYRDSDTITTEKLILTG